MLNTILNVALTEIKMLSRDRRTGIISLLSAFVLGVVFALANPLSLIYLSDNNKSWSMIEVPVKGWKNMPSDLSVFLSSYNFKLVKAKNDLEKSISTAQLGLGLIFPERDRSTNVMPIKILTNSAYGLTSSHKLLVSKFALALEKYGIDSIGKNIIERGLKIEGRKLLEIKTVPLSSSQDSSRSLQPLYAMWLIFFVITIWASNIAAMTMAAEHEQETLESLLMTPANQWQVAVGKSVLVLYVVMVALFVALMGFWITGLTYSLIFGELITFSLSEVFVLMLISLPLMMVFSFLLIDACYNKKNYQGAMTQSGLLGFLLLLIASVASVMTLTNTLYYGIPLFGSIAVISDFVLGKEMSFISLIVSILANAGLWIIILYKFKKSFADRELVLYRQ